MRCRNIKRIMRGGCGYRKETKAIDEITARELRAKYPNHMPLAVAAQYLGLSPRRLSKLIAEGRNPFSGFGANIGIGQTYARVYTERLIAYLNAESTEA